MTPSPAFALHVAASALHDREALRPVLEDYAAPLRALGAVPWEPDGTELPGPLVVLVATGGTERGILDAVPPGEAVVLVAHPGHNSLPAALEATAALAQAGTRARLVVFEGPGDPQALAALRAAVRDHAVRSALRVARIGLVGGASDWLVASRPTPETVRATWGPTVVPLALDALLAAPDATAREEGAELGRELEAGATARLEPSPGDVADAGTVYAALRRMVEAERLDAVTVRCFDLVMARRTTGCLALSRLADEGVAAGCEGDLPATLALLWLQRLLGVVPWMANPSRVERVAGRLIVAHCTVPRRAVGGYRLRSHFESGLGVGLEGDWPAGPVTLVRIGGAQLERLWTAEGEALGSPAHPDLCRTQVEVEIGREALAELLADPLGNHLVVAPGRHAADLRRWHEALVA